jgi:hypothetical protein
MQVLRESSGKDCLRAYCLEYTYSAAKHRNDANRCVISICLDVILVGQIAFNKIRSSKHYMLWLIVQKLMCRNTCDILELK